MRGSWIITLFWGVWLQELWFDAEGGSALILGSREKRTAARCPECGGLFVQGLPPPLREIDPVTGVVTEFSAGDVA